MSMGHKQKISMAEADAFTSWRHVLCYMQRSGVRAGIKRQARRRERRETRQLIRSSR
jgi:hypothetical protein